MGKNIARIVLGLALMLPGAGFLVRGCDMHFNPMTLDEKKEWAATSKNNITGKVLTYDPHVFTDEASGWLYAGIGAGLFAPGLALMLYTGGRAYKRAQSNFIHRGRRRRLPIYPN